MTSMADFEVIKTLGRGAFASVYYVRQRSDGADFVIKKFHRPMDELSAKERQEVAHEIKTQARDRCGRPGKIIVRVPVRLEYVLSFVSLFCDSVG